MARWECADGAAFGGWGDSGDLGGEERSGEEVLYGRRPSSLSRPSPADIVQRPSSTSAVGPVCSSRASVTSPWNARTYLVPLSRSNGPARGEPQMLRSGRRGGSRWLHTGPGPEGCQADDGW